MSEYVTVKDLPAPVQSALSAVGYGSKDIRVETATVVTLSGAGGSGSRSFATLVNLTTGEHATHWGSWGGANMFNPTNPVDNDHNTYPLPANGVAITGSKGGNRPTYAVLHVPASMRDRMLPAAPVDLTTDERNALYCHKAVKGGAYRKDELRRLKVPATAVDAMVTRGYLARNKAGAVSITTDGKNAVGDYRPSYGY